MSVVKDVTFEGQKYNLDNRDRVAAQAAFSGGIGRKVIETGDAAYTVTEADMGAIITNRGSTGTKVITLPDASAALKGGHVTIVTVVAQKTTITSQTADTLIVNGDAEADSIEQASATIGTLAECYCDGTNWIVATLGNTPGGTNAVRWNKAS